ncbi:hypothetical protein BREVUG8_110736 [Brevundimonas sp. G8]|nr:hypothetical protein BREVUG8_110736 [Brevundimonas sp. G8]
MPRKQLAKLSMRRKNTRYPQAIASIVRLSSLKVMFIRFHLRSWLTAQLAQWVRHSAPLGGTGISETGRPTNCCCREAKHPSPK